MPRFLTALLLVGVLGAGSVLAGCSKGAPSGGRVNAGATIGVRIVPVQQEAVHRRVQAVGSLFALDESTISSQVEGPVSRVLVDVGDQVKEGQVLVAIEPIELGYAVEAQRAAVRQVRAQLGIGPNDPPPSDPSKVAFVQRAAADLFDAQQKYDRAKQLFGSQLISREDFDAAAAKYDSAKASHELALQQVDQLAAQLQSSEAMRRLAEKKLADATIRAPYSGAVKERKVSPGEYLRVQSPVMVLVRTDQLRARLEVPEKWAAALELGSMVDVHVDAFPDQTFRGKLVRINPAVSTDSRTFQVEALIPNPGGKLKPGFFIQADLPTEVEEKILTIPGDAVTYTFGTYKVYVVDGEHVTERAIKPGAQTETAQGMRMEVVEGLKAGERLAVAPASVALYDGAPIHQQGR
jgi:membrane fusion protein, multidrug efflux system